MVETQGWVAVEVLPRGPGGHPSLAVSPSFLALRLAKTHLKTNVVVCPKTATQDF